MFILSCGYYIYCSSMSLFLLLYNFLSMFEFVLHLSFFENQAFYVLTRSLVCYIFIIKELFFFPRLDLLLFLHFPFS